MTDPNRIPLPGIPNPRSPRRIERALPDLTPRRRERTFQGPVSVPIPERIFTPQPFPGPVQPAPAIGAGAARILLGGAIGVIIFETARRVIERARELDKEREERERQSEIEIERERARRRIAERELETTRARGKITIPADPDPREIAPDVIAEPLPLPQRVETAPAPLPEIVIPTPVPVPNIPVPAPTIPAPKPVTTPQTAPTLPSPSPAPKPSTRPATRPGTRPTVSPFPFPFPSPIPTPAPVRIPQPRVSIPRVRRVPRLTTPQGTALPSPDVRPFTSAPPQNADRCQEVKRRRRRKGKCREGFFAEYPNKTRFIEWREVDCITREETRTSKVRQKSRDITDRILGELERRVIS